MKQRKIAVIAGTSDATDWIRSLPETDSVTAFVATPVGRRLCLTPVQMPDGRNPSPLPHKMAMFAPPP